MAKQQTFADKAKGKVKADHIAVKCIVSVFDEGTQSWKFRERIIKVKDAKELEAMKF